MYIKQQSIVTFSPTGSTRRVLRLLAEETGAETDEIDLTENRRDGVTKTFSGEELVWIGVPSYGGRVPAAAAQRLGGLKGQGTLAVLVVTFGNRAYDDTLSELQELAGQNGFQAVAAAAVVTEHSIMHQFGAGRPNEDDRAQLKEYARRIREKLEAPGASYIEAGKGINSLTLPGAKPYRAYHGVPIKPRTGRACNSCGKCARECPVGAIDVSNPARTDKDRCISCLRCIQVCPSRARDINPLLLAAASQSMKKACSSPKKNELFL